MSGSIGVVVLAAGGATRMGEPKQLLPFRGRSLIRHAVAAAVAADCGPVVVVLGAAADRIEPELAGLPVRAVRNRDWEAGIGSSVRAGVRPLFEDEGVEAAVVVLADQPRTGPEVIGDLVARFRVDRPPVVAAEYAGTLGVPALFRRDLFPRLLALADGDGAKRVILAAASAAGVPFPGGAFDIDTPLDYARLRDGIGK